MSNRPAHMVEAPRWIPIVRAFQFILAVAIMGMSAYGIYWVSFAAWCLALFTALATFLIIAYNLGTTFIAAAYSAYNYWAVLGLDIFAAVFWLASMAALAALRSTFKYHTVINGCYNDGYGGVCYRKRDSQLHKRAAVATYAYLNMLSTSAGLSALEMLLFILTLSIHAIRLRAHRAAGNPSSPNAAEKGSAQPSTNVNYTPVANPAHAHQQTAHQGPQSPPGHEAIYTNPQTAQSPHQYTQPPHQQTPYQHPTPQYPQPTPSPVSTQYTGYPQPTQSSCPPQQQYAYSSPTQSTAYHPSPMTTPTVQDAQLTHGQEHVHEVPTYHAAPVGVSEVSGERR